MALPLSGRSVRSVPTGSKSEEKIRSGCMYKSWHNHKDSIGHLKISGAYLNKGSLLADTLGGEALIILWVPLGPLAWWSLLLINVLYVIFKGREYKTLHVTEGQAITPLGLLEILPGIYILSPSMLSVEGHSINILILRYESKRVIYWCHFLHINLCA